MHRSRWPIMVVCLIGLALRLGWALAQPAEPSPALPDQMEYLAIARNLLLGQGLQFADHRFGEDAVYAFRSPGYPGFIALLGANPRAVRIAQATLDASVILAVYLLAKRWLDERGALLAAALVAFNPFLIFFAGLILSESLFTAALTWGISQLGRKKLLGVLPLALAVIVRPPVMWLVPVACALAALPGRRRCVIWTLTGAAVTVLVLLPWANRNHQLLGRWIWTTTNTGQTTYDGFRPGADGSSNLAELPTMPQLQGHGEVERNDILNELGHREMMNDLPRAAGLALKKLARTWSPVPLSDEYASTRNKLIAIAYAGPLMLLTLVGLFRRTIPEEMKALLLLPALYFTAAAAITVGSLRYRVPAEPLMIVVAASAIVKPKPMTPNPRSAIRNPQ